MNSEQIIRVLEDEIANFNRDDNVREVGTVLTVGDGIVSVYGMSKAFYGEVVTFESGERGMVLDIGADLVRCILFGRDRDVSEGMEVHRTGEQMAVPVGDAFLGRVVNALGDPLDGKGPIPADGSRPVESPAPGILDRQPVDTPMAAGMLAIDSMFPIGRGQRELIIGDRQTGKTTIAVDTMLNQKGKDVVCVYVAIGQKASSVAQLARTLEAHDALDYSIVVSASAADPASLQYIAPYTGTAIAEHYMHAGRDVLIIYDDLSKHAVAYRTLSLLLGRSPGREAYPGDVFYLHSRLLERSSHLSDALGGGSITALPIVETQSGDVSAYIPTNIISITDGQIFLESALFHAGTRPAVNVGLSVSRVGGAAQTGAMKAASGSIRIDLAQYRELETFTQFSSDLDDATKAQLGYGQRLMELLKQPVHSPMSLADQVISLVCAEGGVLNAVPVDQIKAEQRALLDAFKTQVPDVADTIETQRSLDDALKAKILATAKDLIASRS